MDTSLRLRGGGFSSMRIHAKEKLSLGTHSLLQAQGEIDTVTGYPSFLALLVRKFYPKMATSIGVGVQLDQSYDVNYTLRGKKAFPIASNGLLGLNIKGRVFTDKELLPKKKTAAVELAWSILDFKKDQDVRIKLGYELHERVAYLQLRENNWTINAFANGRWDVRFDL